MNPSQFVFATNSTKYSTIHLIHCVAAHKNRLVCSIKQYVCVQRMWAIVQMIIFRCMSHMQYNIVYYALFARVGRLYLFIIFMFFSWYVFFHNLLKLHNILRHLSNETTKTRAKNQLSSCRQPMHKYTVVFLLCIYSSLFVGLSLIALCNRYSLSKQMHCIYAILESHMTSFQVVLLEVRERERET